MISKMTRRIGKDLVDDLSGLLARCIDDGEQQGPAAEAVRQARVLLIEAGF